MCLIIFNHFEIGANLQANRSEIVNVPHQSYFSCLCSILFAELVFRYYLDGVKRSLTLSLSSRGRESNRNPILNLRVIIKCFCCPSGLRLCMKNPPTNQCRSINIQWVEKLTLMLALKCEFHPVTALHSSSPTLAEQTNVRLKTL